MATSTKASSMRTRSVGKRRLQAARAGGGELDATAKACGLEVGELLRFYELFAQTPAVITAFSQGVNQSSSGTDKVNAIINCHLATGRIGKPGAGPFSVTGQPNAMGGREVGGFVNTLAAHVDLHDEPGRAAVKNFWHSPAIATKQGPKAVEMFDRIHEGKIKAVWIMATNPVVSLPDADKVKEALRNCEFVAVSDVMGNTDTAALAHVLLPALAWGEKDGTVTNSDRTISRQRAVPAAARRSARGLAHGLRRGARHGLRGIQLHFAARDLPRTRAAHGASQRWPAHAESRRLGEHHGRRIQELAARRLAHGRVARVGEGPHVRRWKIHASRRQGAFPAADTAPARERSHAGIPAGVQHRPRARSLAHHDAHREVRAAVRARRRALCRNQYRRCAAFQSARR